MNAAVQECDMNDHRRLSVTSMQSTAPSNRFDQHGEHPADGTPFATAGITAVQFA